MSLWFMVPITIVFMRFINHLITGGPHLVWMKEIMKSDQPPKGWLKLYKSWDVSHQLVQDFATIHSMNGT